MKNRTITLLHPNWSEWGFKEKKEYLLMIKKVLK